MIYRPPEREPRPRGRLNPTREIAVVLVLVALVLAVLLPVAFPNVPLPQLPGATAVAVAPPTPVSMPQPYAATPVVGLGGSATTLTPPFGSATLDPFAADIATPTVGILEFPTELPTYPSNVVLPSATVSVITPIRTLAPVATPSIAYPGAVTATVATPSPSPTVGSPTPTVSPTATVTGTPPTATPTATPGTPTVTPSATAQS